VKILLEKYRNIDKANDIINQINEIEKYDRQIDTNFIYGEIDTLIDGIEEGANRTKDIVLGLRTFSRMDEEEFKFINVNENLDSTLMLLKNKTKNRIEIHKDYYHEAEIECIPGKINQVFMNILNNAIQAIDDKGELFVTTRNDDKNIIISIRDTGKGMTQEIKNRIFEPFYTTKDVGKGTGLGLSITYGIIEKHNGKIEVNSVPGKGSEFVITLPKHAVSS
jgi:signal transduction histidine kinase